MITLREVRAAAMMLAFAVAPVAAETLTLDRLALGESRSVEQTNAEPVIVEAARRAGIQLAFKLLPPMRSLESADEGETDGNVARVGEVAQIYPNLMAVPTPVSKMVIVIYAATPDIATRTRAEILQSRICTLRGHIATRKHTRGLAVAEANLPASLFDMLASGRCDVLMADYVEAEPYLRVKHLTGIYRWPHAWAIEPMYMMLNKKHAALVPRLDAALRQMTREGLIERAFSDGLRAYRIEPPPSVEPAAR